MGLGLQIYEFFLDLYSNHVHIIITNVQYHLLTMHVILYDLPPDPLIEGIISHALGGGEDGGERGVMFSLNRGSPSRPTDFRNSSRGPSSGRPSCGNTAGGYAKLQRENNFLFII